MSRYIDADYVIKKIESRIGYFNQYYPGNTENIRELKICCDIVNDAPMLENRITTEEAINILYGMQADNLNLDDDYTKDKYEALDMAIKALEQTDGDLISRTELLNKIWQKEYGKDYDGVNLLNIPHIDIIEQMPSANKTEECEISNIYDILTEHTALLNDIKMMMPKTAEWINKNGIKTCNNCGIGLASAYDNYCPNCGAKMKGEEE